MNVASPAHGRILYVITKANWGGAQRYVYDLAVEAKQRGFAPALAYGEPGLLAERMEAAGIPAFRVEGLVRDPSLGDDLRALSMLVSLFRTEQPQVVHLNSSKAGLLGALAARMAGVPNIIFTAHGWAFTESRGKLAKAVFVLFHYVTVFCTTYTICVSEAVARHARSWPFVQKKLRTIRLGITPPAYRARADARTTLIERAPELAPFAQKLWVGTIAELHKNKGLDVGIAAWHQAAPEAEWLLLGGGEEETALKRASIGVAGVHFLGFVPDAAQYLAAFDLFLLPSRTEALGYVLLEAAFAGVPVLASDVGGIPEVVTDRAMRVPPGDADALAHRLTDVLAGSASLPATGAALRAHAEQTFAFSSMADATLALYEHI